MALAQLPQVNVKFIPTSRGGRYLCVDGYMYRLNKRKADEWIFWKCLSKDCNATTSTINDVVSKPPTAHNHEPVHNDIKIRQTLGRLKLKARSTLQPMPSLFNEELLSLRHGAWTDDNRTLIQNMPTYHGVKSQLYATRRSVFPAMPTHRAEIQIPEEYQRTDAGERFLSIDDGDDEKILGFTTRNNLEHLCATDVVYGDGTFYVSPNLFLQLYTIHAKVADQMFPLVFFLLPNKTTATYTRAFRLLKQLSATYGLQLTPSIIKMDFEVATKTAALSVFPGSTWKRCFFHFAQCIWRKTQNVGLQVEYRLNQDIGRFIRRCAGLPLVPVENVEDVWVDVIADMPNDPRCWQVADYMTINWVEGDISSWNHHDTDGPRTNNNLEGWHGRLKKIVGKAHPNVFEMVKFLLEEQKLNEIKMLQYSAGQRLPPRQKKYRELERNLASLKDRLAQGQLDLLNYLDMVSHAIKLA